MRILFSVTLMLLFYGASAQAVTSRESAEFPGGMRKFYEYLGTNTVYPKKAKKGIEGKVYVAFIITEKGNVDQDSIRVVRPDELKRAMTVQDNYDDVLTDKVFEAEAMRVIKASPPWKPASVNKIPMNQLLILPVRFR